MSKSKSDILNPACRMKSVKQPFHFLKFKNVLHEQFAEKLKKDISNVPFEPTCSDLFSFMQTKNLLNIDVTPTISLFIEALLGKISNMLSSYYKIEFNKKISLTSSVYGKGDFLLCHDDASDDRAVAFIFYLTDDPWLKSYGGSLDLFKTINGEVTHLTKHVYPKFNSLICFKVCPDRTYHQVSEITKNVHRLTINGWFHSDQTVNQSTIIDEIQLTLKRNIHFYSIGAHSYLTEFINKSFFTQSVIKNFQNEFSTNSIVGASDFFRECTLSLLTNELELNTEWQLQGPPYKRKYDVGSIDSLPITLRTLVHFLISLEWFNYIEIVTGFNKNTLIHSSFEIQRWLPGYYTLLYFKNIETFHMIDVFIIVNLSDSSELVNSIMYSPTATLCSNHPDKQKFQLSILNNHIYIVHRKSTSSWFIKYLQKQKYCKFYIFQMTYIFKQERGSNIRFV